MNAGNEEVGSAVKQRRTNAMANANAKDVLPPASDWWRAKQISAETIEVPTQ